MTEPLVRCPSSRELGFDPDRVLLGSMEFKTVLGSLPKLRMCE